MSLTSLQKALQYCKLFTTDQDKAVFGYGYIDGNKVLASDTCACIACSFVGDKEQRLVPLSKGAIASMADTSEYKVPDYDAWIGNTDKYQGAFIMHERRGLGKMFELWKDVFSFCKKISSEEEAKCLLEVTHDGLYAYALGIKGINAKFELCDGKAMEFLRYYTPHGALATEHLINICEVLAKTNPSSAIFYTNKDLEQIYIETDDVQCKIMGKRMINLEPVKIFYERERRLFHW